MYDNRRYVNLMNYLLLKISISCFLTAVDHWQLKHGTLKTASGAAVCRHGDVYHRALGDPASVLS